MIVKNLVVSMCATNCYIAYDESSMAGFIVDPGDEATRIIDTVDKLGVKPEAILITHGHFDHMGAAKEVALKYGIKVYANEAEKDVLADARYNLSGPFCGGNQVYEADEFLKDMQEIDIAGFHIIMYHTPGHTPGGCCYYIPREEVLFSGDTLFCQSVGRTDFPGGSMRTLVDSIKEKLMVLPMKTVVYPGHNESTTLEEERMYNPFL